MIEPGIQTENVCDDVFKDLSQALPAVCTLWKWEQLSRMKSADLYRAGLQFQPYSLCQSPHHTPSLTLNVLICTNKRGIIASQSYWRIQ